MRALRRAQSHTTARLSVGYPTAAAASPATTASTSTATVHKAVLLQCAARRWMTSSGAAANGDGEDLAAAEVAAVSASVAADAPGEAMRATAASVREAKGKFEAAPRDETDTPTSDLGEVAAARDEDDEEIAAAGSVEAAAPKARSGFKPINVAERYDARLKALPVAPLDAITTLSPDDAVTLAAQYIHMQHYVRSLRRRRVPHTDVVQLKPLFEEALLCGAVKAVEDRAVPIEAALRLLRPPYLLTRMLRHRRYLATMLRAWAVERILTKDVDAALARKLLLIAKHFGRDARIVGSLANIAVADPAATAEQLIRVLFCVGETYVRPPAEFWSGVLRRLVETMHRDGLSTRQCYRILEVCARTGVFTDVNLLAQVAEHAWTTMGKRAVEAKLSDRVKLKRHVALKRLQRVSDLQPNQLFRLIQTSASLGTQFSAGRGAVTDKVIIPLIWHLSDAHVIECIEAVAASRSLYAPIYQHLIDRIVAGGDRTPAALLQVSRVLRVISRHNELCTQLRLAKFFVLLEAVCGQKHVLRIVQMTRLIEDMYYITRRFERGAPIVQRLQTIVDSFCAAIAHALDRGVASIDQVNSVLEHTVMLGMASKDRFPNVQRLRELRKEVYSGTAPGSFPVGYRERASVGVRHLYSHLIFCNQMQALFHQTLDRTMIDTLNEQFVICGCADVLKAASTYRELHGRALPLSPFLQNAIMRFLRHQLSDVHTGDSVEKIALACGVPANRNPTALLQELLQAIHRPAVLNLRHQSFYLECCNALATAINDGEALAKISNYQREAIY